MQKLRQKLNINKKNYTQAYFASTNFVQSSFFAIDKRLFACAILLAYSICAFYAQSTSIVQAAYQKGTIKAALAYLEEASPQATTNTEKRDAYFLLAKLHKQNGAYLKAYQAYAQGIAVDTANPNTKQRLDAALCALNIGEVTVAEQVLDDVLKINPSDAEKARAKLYAVWCGVLKANNADELDYPISLLVSFLADPAMKSIECQVLFSLWWLSTEEAYAVQLQNAYPSSVEATITKGTSALLPEPYWYFVPRRGKGAGFDINDAAKRAEQLLTEKIETDKNDGKVTYQQVGLFRDDANASNCVKRLKQQGFDAEIKKQTRPSGTVYSAVVVRETDGTMGDKLRNAGFECYPIFE